MSLFKRKVESIREKEKEHRQVKIQKEKEGEEKIEAYEKIRIDAQNCLKQLVEEDKEFLNYIENLMEECDSRLELLSISHDYYRAEMFGGLVPYRWRLWLQRDFRLVMERSGKFLTSSSVYRLLEMPEEVRCPVEEVLKKLQNPDSALDFFLGKFGIKD